MSDWLELAIIAFIVIGIGWVVFRGGQANPESTGDLGQQLASLSSEQRGMNARLGELEKDVDRLDKDAASKADIKRVEKGLAELTQQVADLSKNAAGREATLAHVASQVDRLYQVIVSKGMQ